MALSDQQAVIEGRPRESRLSWRKLLRVSGVGGALLMAIVAVALGDLEAGAVAVVLGVLIVLLRFRSGFLGKLGIALVSAVTFAFMVTAAVTNVRTGSPIGAVLLSAGLASVFLIGLVSAAMSLGKEKAPSAGPWLVVGASGLLLVGLLAWSSLAAKRSTVVADVILVAEDVTFSQTQLSAPSGELTVAMANKDLFWHTFTIEELGVDLLVPVGANRTVTLEVSPGQYRFICRIPGHTDAGMDGTLIITG